MLHAREHESKRGAWIKAKPGGEAALPPACAIGAFIGLHGQKFSFKNSDLAWVKIQRSSELKLKYDAEDEILENKSGLWTYKGRQGPSYSSLVVF